jgi:hypothetical protein
VKQLNLGNGNLLSKESKLAEGFGVNAKKVIKRVNKYMMDKILPITN